MKQNRNEIQNIVTNYLLLMWFILKLWTQALKYKTSKQIAHEETNKTRHNYKMKQTNLAKLKTTELYLSYHFIKLLCL